MRSRALRCERSPKYQPGGLQWKPELHTHLAPIPAAPWVLSRAAPVSSALASFAQPTVQRCVSGIAATASKVLVPLSGVGDATGALWHGAGAGAPQVAFPSAQEGKAGGMRWSICLLTLHGVNLTLRVPPAHGVGGFIVVGA